MTYSNLQSPFGEHHELFRKTVSLFVKDEIIPYVNEWETNEEIPRDLFRRMGELGFLGVEFPTEFSGAGADFWMSVVLAEELAKCRAGGVAFSIIVHTDMSSPWLINLGTIDQKNKYLPDIISGKKICALAITEPQAGSDMVSIGTTATLEDDNWVINGSKTFITNGVYGDLYFVAARTSSDGPTHQQLSQFLVEAGTPGLTVSKKLTKTGMWSSDTAELVFENVKIPKSNLLGEQGKGFYQLAAGLQRERLMASILCVSASEQALEDCKSYLKQRQAFGNKLSEFQALRHRIADMAVSIEAARHLTYHAASKFSTDQDCVTEVSMAKLFSTEMANKIAYDAVQLHGGYGYIREFHIERFARDYRLWSIAAGTSEMMKEVISKRLLS